MASNTCRCCMHIIEIAWVKLYHEWNFLEHSWFSKLDFEVKGHFMESAKRNCAVFEDGGLDGRLGNDFQDEVPSFPSIDRQVPSSSISHPDSYYLAFDMKGIIWPRMQSECTLYKSSKAGLCLDLMILSKLSKACQNFCQTNWNIKRLHFVCWRWLFWLLKIFNFDLIKIIAPVSKYCMTSWFYQSDINWNIWVIIQGHPVTKGVTKGVAVLVIFWTGSKFYPHFDPVFSIYYFKTSENSTVIQRLYENWLDIILTTVT